MDGLFGSGAKHPHRTYTDWALASLCTNGLDPRAIPASVLPDVLELLLRTGRTVAQDEWISSVKHQTQRAALLTKFERAGIKASPPPA